jgi:DNA-binding LytR/AlgR family response regulator
MIRICVLDDDPVSLDKINEILTEYLSTRKVSFDIDQYQCGDDLLKAVFTNHKSYQIYFLDILMPGITGIEAAKEIRKLDKSAHIIFLTSSSEYALDGYAVRAYDYLQKPLDCERLFQTLSELLGIVEKSSTKWLQIKTNGVLKNIPYHNICYIEAQRNKLLVVQNNGEHVEFYSTFSNIVNLLKDEPEFTQTHRSYIINMCYIREFTSTSIKLQSGFQIPVSRNYSNSAKQDYFEFAKSFFN